MADGHCQQQRSLYPKPYLWNFPSHSIWNLLNPDEIILKEGFFHFLSQSIYIISQYWDKHFPCSLLLPPNNFLPFHLRISGLLTGTFFNFLNNYSPCSLPSLPAFPHSQQLHHGHGWSFQNLGVSVLSFLHIASVTPTSLLILSNVKPSTIFSSFCLLIF